MVSHTLSIFSASETYRFRGGSEALQMRSTAWLQGPACLLADNEGFIKDVNEAALRLLRRSNPAEVIGKPVSQFGIIDELVSPITKYSGSPVAQSGSISTTHATQSTKPRIYARLASAVGEGSESNVKSYWLNDPRNPTISHSSSISSPIGRRTLDHLRNNALGRIAAVAGDDYAGQVVHEIGNFERVLDQSNLLKNLEEYMVVARPTDNSPREALKNILKQKTIAPYLSRILIDQGSLSLLETPLSLDWERLEYIMLSFIENACKHTKGSVKLSLSYDSFSNLHVKIMDEGDGIQADTNYLERAINGKAGPDYPEEDVKPGLIFRICHLLCERVLTGHLNFKTSLEGTHFHLVIPGAPVDVTMADLDICGSVGGAGCIPQKERSISAATLTPPRGLPLKLPHMTELHMTERSDSGATSGGGLIGRIMKTFGAKPAAETAYAVPADRRDILSDGNKAAKGLAASSIATVISGGRPSGPVRGLAPLRAMKLDSALSTLARRRGGEASLGDSSIEETPPKHERTPPRLFTLPPIHAQDGIIAAMAPYLEGTGDIAPILTRRVIIHPFEPDTNARASLFGAGFAAQPSPKAAGGEAIGAGGMEADNALVLEDSHPPIKGVAMHRVLETVFVNLAVKLGISVPNEKPAAGGFGRRASEVDMSGSTLPVINKAGVRNIVDLTAPPSVAKTTAMESAASAHGAVAARLPRTAPVLIVEDEKVISRMLKKCLNKISLSNVNVADNGLTAISMMTTAIAAGNPYLFVFMDQVMPRFNGKETCLALRAMNKDIIIIPATSNFTPEDLASYADVGMRVDPMLAKPLTMDAIKRVVNTYFAPESAVPTSAHDAAAIVTGATDIAASTGAGKL